MRRDADRAAVQGRRRRHGGAQGRARADRDRRRWREDWTWERIDRLVRAILLAGAYELMHRQRRAAQGRDQRVCRDRPRLLRPGRAELRQFGARSRGAPGAVGRARGIADRWRAAAHRRIRADRPLLRAAGPAASPAPAACRATTPSCRPMPRHDLVVKTDTIVAGVHFLADEKPELVAAKALRVSLSDLAAGGATPFAYQLSLSLAEGWTERWVAGFARGLAADQRRFGIVLCGGDTVGHARTAHRYHHRLRPRAARPRPDARRRAGGRRLWVSGTIGDGALGLLAARGRLDGAGAREALSPAAAAHDARAAPGRHCVARRPTSPTACWPMPAISPTPRGLPCRDRARARAAVGRRAACARGRPALWANVLGGGDDYELVIAVPPGKERALLAAARAADVKVTHIGRFERGRGVGLTVAGGRCAHRAKATFTSECHSCTADQARRLIAWGRAAGRLECAPNGWLDKGRGNAGGVRRRCRGVRCATSRCWRSARR